MRAIRLLPLLLLSLPGVAIPLQLSDQHLLKTGLKEVRLVAELGGYAVVAGRRCLDCDENPAIYIFKIPRPGEDVAAIEAASERYTYPGRYVDYLSKTLVEKTRMFYGRCYEGMPSLLWLSEYRVNDDWVKSEYLIVFGDKGPEHRYNENRQPSLYYIDNRDCVELPGVAAETEP
ncbi:hypothetical protein [Microbulbifer thermotolerans]|uniref:Uncharacterized protein n=1 Tax=Microbulbifer thermotolerans TaxID=252514 RepID=A0AB35HWX3_MICTH|nr:hypothetical protein [Microbulbifer thermotolerans]MCX2801306.1 hypothetical protein [Microbulbifer thermotolerans]MCX2830602.1 hypothetical protein [Microbulbifer thermotolerans]MCX2842567.1 hypothetical protein [Microbulbifer thermotolerans]